jgi:hypothetical protein
MKADIMRRHAFLSGLTGLLLLSAPALAQTPPPGPPPALPTQVETPEAIRIEPGSTIHSSDGAALGRLEGWRTTPAGAKELIVRGEDGRFRAVPAEGVKRVGEVISVGWTHHQFVEAPVLAPPAGNNPPGG